MTDEVLDFVGIGLGPFNLSLACLAEPLDDLNGLFVDENPGFDWHPGMLLEGTRLQTPFMSDLVTLADPTSRYSFLNYAKQQGHLYSFYIRENFYLLRREYNQYCQWAARELSNLRFNTRVEWIERDAESGLYRLRLRDTRRGTESQLQARRLVLGTGTRAQIPACCEGLSGPIHHSSRYLHERAAIQDSPSITVIGGGQSAAEIVHDLLSDIDRHNYRLHWVTRSERFFPLEYTKLTLEMTSPEYVDYFHALPAARRDALVQRQKNLYKGINEELINAIFDLLYSKRLGGELPVTLHTNTALQAVQSTPGGLRLGLHHAEQGLDWELDTASLILATGYAYREPECLKGIAGHIRRDAQGHIDARRNYSIDTAGNEIFVQNVELPTHGFVTPDLGMVCYRNSWILRALSGRECYPIEQRIAFQQFGAADLARPDARRSA